MTLIGFLKGWKSVHDIISELQNLVDNFLEKKDKFQESSYSRIFPLEREKKPFVYFASNFYFVQRTRNTKEKHFQMTVLKVNLFFFAMRVGEETAFFLKFLPPLEGKMQF